MADEQSNGSKPFAGILAVLALAGGASAFFMPMAGDLARAEDKIAKLSVQVERVGVLESRLANLEERLSQAEAHTRKEGHPMSVIQSIAEVRADFERHDALPGHSAAQEKMATLSEKFAEVETQFEWLSDVLNREIRHIWRELGVDGANGSENKNISQNARGK